ncbi:hypothetical protein Hanom_Chr13g01198291 [Helianthus anomalus]
MDILALGVPMANECERTQTIIRRLKRRFPADDNDDDDVFYLPTVTGSSLDEQSRMMKVTYQNGDDDSLTMDEVLNTDRLHLLEQLYDLAHSHAATSKIVIIFKYMIRDRRNQLMALYANDLDDDKSEEIDEQIDWYIYDVTASTKEY